MARNKLVFNSWFLVYIINTMGNAFTSVNCVHNLKKKTVIRIFFLSGWLTSPINPDKWSSNVY